ncbi:hypothetical protein [Deinococcus deserti]|uniref:Uncharacterized protein n=1 Tax=Deinococcus deserti (strain DSM 17065 / CIP 109153 / LMG 22923 / VCD115) TaxID=546414 RepID=C1D1E5_DEIDV|nr:hypothetical protein [Deinococcus deserti]ACO45669.3 hypothetical protein Deide_08040 [Deinococcus deserti VCD115]
MHLAYLPYPPPEEVERRALALAVLDAVLSPEWEDRCFSFDRGWSAGTRMASARNGSGDEAFMLFSQGECIFKEFLHEVPQRLLVSEVRATAGAADQMPLLEEFLAEPAFSMQLLTELGWYTPRARHWVVMSSAGAPTEDSLFRLLFQGDGPQYAAWASDLFERPVREDVVELVFQGVPLTPFLVQGLNPDADWHSVHAEAAEMGYPVQTT